MSEKIDPKETWSIALDNMTEPTVMTCSIPIRKWANDNENGRLLVAGFFEMARQMAMRNFMVIQSKKSKLGVINPNGKPN